MKFARYLQDTQTPEWKRAYIDYRGLKKRITAIKREQEASARKAAQSPSHDEEANSSRHSSVDTQRPLQPSRDDPQGSASAHHESNAALRERHHAERPANKRTTSRALSFSGIRRGTTLRSRNPANRSPNLQGSPSSALNPPFATPLPLHDLTPLLYPVEQQFFTALDAELEKIENFYLDREKEMRARSHMLKEQLVELGDHRKLFYAAHPQTVLPWASVIKPIFKIHLKPRFSGHNTENPVLIVEDTDARDEARSSLGDRTQEDEQPNPDYKLKGREENHSGEPEHFSRKLDPDEYLSAKKKLKKAVLEHYRGLEVLHNYRVLNVTGFRKALKKFEKTSKIPAQEAYMKEKVDTSAIASGASVDAMMKEMESLFAARFVHGDKKKATKRLRAGSMPRSHHLSTFITGTLLGLAIPAFVSGIYHSFQQSTRDAIPGWAALLNVYAVLFIPVIFSMLVGLNLLVFHRSRINYVFIFELDTQTRLGHHDYFEMPGLLLVTLCYAFWLSFARIGAPSISPTLWPLVWLAFTAVIMFDPLPILYKPSRYWLIRNVAKLLISGTRRVEFTDFWMGDQFCSLTFSLSNLYYFACVYTKGFDIHGVQCSASTREWGIIYVLAILPLLVRLVQSVKRYVDSGLITHLINGGKYGSGIISYLFYYLWRHQGSQRGAIFILWCLFNTIYTIYASSWDYLMDWSLLRPHSPQPLLRPELIYSDHVMLYYFAIVSNAAIRFAWVLYIPQEGPSTLLRSFIVAMLEMLRRWQWNFYRLENEHLGNVDQYRVTRELPLPYAFDDTGHEDDEDVDGDEDAVAMGWLNRQRSSLRSRLLRVSEANASGVLRAQSPT